MEKNLFEISNKNNRGEEKSAKKKSLHFDLYKKNTLNSIHDVECFLNNFHHYIKYLKLYKIMKK